MSPETEGRLFNLAAAKDRLRGIGNVTHRALRYTPRSVKHAVIGAFAGVVMVGYACFAEQRIQAIPPDTNHHKYSRESAGNKVATDNPLLFIAGGAVLAVTLGRTGPWIIRRLEAFCPELKPPE